MNIKKTLHIASCIIGLILIVIGLLIYGIFPLMLGGPITALLGLILVGQYIFINRNEIKESVSVRSAKYGSNTLIFVAVVFVIICLISVFSQKHRIVIDTTSHESNSLSGQTLDIISDLDSVIEILGFVNKKDINYRTTFRSLCDQYSYYSKGKITCRLIEPDENPALSREFKVSSNKDRVFGFRKGQKLGRTKYLLEEDFTNAIIKLKQDIKKKVYVITGHGEGSVNSELDKGFKKLQIKLENIGYQVIEIFLPQQTSIPNDCSVLMILSPQHGFMESEITKINDYLNKGGSVLMLLDPFNEPGLDQFLAKWGLQKGNNIVIDYGTGSNLDGNPTVPLISSYSMHPITKENRGNLAQTYFSEACTIRPLSYKVKDIVSKALLVTSGGYTYSYAENDLETYKNQNRYSFNVAEDIKGPITIAYVSTKIIENKKTGKKELTKKNYKDEFIEAKLVVYGDSDFASNSSIDFSSNGALILNTINWLSGDLELISIDRPVSNPNVIRLTNATRKLFYYIFLVLIPGIICFTGVFIWWKKR